MMAFKTKITLSMSKSIGQEDGRSAAGRHPVIIKWFEQELNI